MTYTEEQLWGMATDVRCLTCGDTTALEWLGIELASEDDLDQVYEEAECCDDPAFEALIISEQPIFDREEVNDDARIRANPGLGITSDRYEYTLGEDLLNSVNEED